MLIVAALYHFSPLPDYVEWRESLQKFCDEKNIKGILLVASEGINGTVCGARESIDALLVYIRAHDGFENLVHKESFAQTSPFYRMKVRVKKEIVTLKRPEADPNKYVGEYVDPRDWNDLIADLDTVVLDTRNDYEVKIGTFKRAINPNTETFVEFPKFVEENLADLKDKKIAMFCTGGIRCEKASSYMLSAGFDKVYHLKGGILKYLEETPVEESLWEGNCFVFDQRVSVGHGLVIGDEEPCYGCRRPLTPIERQSSFYEKGVQCEHCHDVLTSQQILKNRERQKQIDLAEIRHIPHMGVTQKRHLNTVEK